MKGWVYVISNRAMPDLIKVGFTLKDPALRAAELNHTGSPHPYTVDYEVLVNEPRNVEQTVHSHMKNYREGKEWFRCTVEDAVLVIQGVVGGGAHIENFISLDRRAILAENQRRNEAQRVVAYNAKIEAEKQQISDLDRKRKVSFLLEKQLKIKEKYELDYQNELTKTGVFLHHKNKIYSSIDGLLDIVFLLSFMFLVPLFFARLLNLITIYFFNKETMLGTMFIYVWIPCNIYLYFYIGKHREKREKKSLYLNKISNQKSKEIQLIDNEIYALNHNK